MVQEAYKAEQADLQFSGGGNILKVVDEAWSRRTSTAVIDINTEKADELLEQDRR